MWQQLLKGTIQIPSGDTDLFCDRIWDECRCACLPGTGVRELLLAKLSDPTTPTSVAWRMFSLAIRHNVNAPVVKQFIETKLSTSPGEAWPFALTNLLLVKDISNLGTKFSSYAKTQDLASRLHLLKHLSQGVPTTKFTLPNELVEEILLFVAQILEDDHSINTKVCSSFLHSS